jgi:hypothetical protein
MRGRPASQTANRGVQRLSDAGFAAAFALSRRRRSASWNWLGVIRDTTERRSSIASG